VYPTGTPKLEAAALVHECDAHLRQLDRFFGVAGPHVVAFVFAGADQKGYLMGAAGTYIAKPWRREIYIQRAGFPHPVMRHELARVKGIATVRGWYGGASLESLTGQGLPALEAEWLASLDRLKVGNDVLQVARARFDQPAIFGRRCPHVVDRLEDEAGAALGQ